MKKLKNLTLELSAKAFRDDSEKTMFRVCRTMFEQYRFLAKYAEQISVMLWLADGSEILEYTGNGDDTFQWACWCGCANTGPDRNLTGRRRRNTHYYPKAYIPDPEPRKYNWIKRLNEVIRQTGKEILDREIRIGAIFDNGPEFAISAFKYKIHPEIAQAHTLFPNSFAVCTAKLHADQRHYAAFPEGITEGTGIGLFLGKQFKVYAEDMGFDYLWLSNGMGFGTETWGITGMLFDKEHFYPEKSVEAAALMRQFWNDFFTGSPECVVETRGSNFSAGLEIATDAAPLSELFRKENISVPVNSPWAALNYQSGREVAAYLSHIAPAENKTIPFRYYIHDPWFMNSPYLDRYAGETWDIFLPMACSRINRYGETEAVSSTSLLTVDSTWGDMPERPALEVSTRIGYAIETAPDAPGPLVWIYPFEHYSKMVLDEQRGNDEIFLEELFMSEAIQNAFPLNTVMEKEIFLKLEEDNELPEKIWVIPASAIDEQMIEVIKKITSRKGIFLIYGALNHAEKSLLDLLNISLADSPLTGEISVRAASGADRIPEGTFPEKLIIQEQFSAGGLREILRPAEDITILAEAYQAEETRILGMIREFPGGGKIAFIRGVLPDCGTVNKRSCYFDYALPGTTFPEAKLLRDALALCGWKIGGIFEYPAQTLPTLAVHRHNNAFYFSGFVPDTGMQLQFSTPYGAPLWTNSDVVICDDTMLCHSAATLRKECRCFVKQKEKSKVSIRPRCQGYPEYTLFDRRYISGLKNAEIRYFPPEDFHGTFEFQVYPEIVGESTLLETPLLDFQLEDTPDGRCAVIRNVTGVFYISLVKPEEELAVLGLSAGQE